MAKPGEGLLYGFQLSLGTDGKTVTVSNGLTYIPDLGRIYTEVPTSVVVSGISNAWAHFYIALVANTAVLEFSITAPTAPYQNTARTKTGDSSRRYVGSIYFNANSLALPFLHSNFGMQNNRIDYMMPGGIASANAAIISVGTSQTAVTLSAANFAPPTTRLVRAQLINTAALSAYISNPEIGTPSSTSYLRIVLPNNADQCDLVLDSSQQLNYVYGAGITLGGSLAIRAIGYIFDR